MLKKILTCPQQFIKGAFPPFPLQLQEQELTGKTPSPGRTACPAAVPVTERAENSHGAPAPSPALPFVLISSINCSLARGPGDTQEGSLWLSPVSVVPAMSVIPSAGLALPGSRRAPLALLQTHSGLTLVEQEWPQSKLEASAPSPGPCSLCASSKGSPMFCQGHEECPAAPLCSQWEKSLLWAERE